MNLRCIWYTWFAIAFERGHLGGQRVDKTVVALQVRDLRGFSFHNLSECRNKGFRRFEGKYSKSERMPLN